MNEDLTVVQKCLVDTDNIFTFGNVKMKIDDDDTDYKVYSTYKKNPDDYTNLASMIYVYVCVSQQGRLVFLNEKFRQIKKVYIYE